MERYYISSFNRRLLGLTGELGVPFTRNRQ